jgi:predicted nuclease of predicted toxin-antitoxin system
VVTKDDDFVQSHLIFGRPEKLLLVATGNIGNTELEILLRKNLASIIQALDGVKFVEIDREALTIHA